jgi:hypothetical protein
VKDLIHKVIKKLFWRTFSEAIEFALDRNERNIVRAMRRIAAEDTARFITENMPHVRYYEDRWALLEHAISEVSADGIYTEFGVFQGASLKFIAARTDRHVFGFDSFEGLPEDWVLNFDKERFKVKNLPNVASHVNLVKGWYDDTVPKFAADNDEPIAFSHIDCDLLSSTKTIFDHLGERLKPGSVIVFDEFFNYPGWRIDGEYPAFVQFIEETGKEFKYIGYTGNSACAAVKFL